MNQRIFQLAKQAEIKFEAHLQHLGIDTAVITPTDLEKFAELIVAECITTILKESKWYWDKDEFESANAVQNAARRVKEHFGVE